MLWIFFYILNVNDINDHSTNHTTIVDAISLNTRMLGFI